MAPSPPARGLPPTVLTPPSPPNARWRIPPARRFRQVARSSPPHAREEPTVCPPPTAATGCPDNVTTCGTQPTVCPAQPVSTKCPESATHCPETSTTCPQFTTYCPKPITQCVFAPTVCTGNQPTNCSGIATLCPRLPAPTAHNRSKRFARWSAPSARRCANKCGPTYYPSVPATQCPRTTTACPVAADPVPV